MPSASRGLEKYDPHVKVRSLSDVGSVVEIDASVPLKRYFRSGKEMLRMADVYCHEGDLESAYILYTKYITLFVEKISKHPGMKGSYLPEWDQTKQTLKQVFPIAEKLKSELIKKYTQEYNIMVKNKERQEAEAALQEERRNKERMDRLEEVVPDRPATPTPPCGGLSPSDVYPLLLPEVEDASGTPLPKTATFAPLATDFQVPDIPSRASKPSAPPLAPLDVVRRAIPTVDRSTKPLPLLSPEPYFLGTQGLRTVVVPESLFSRFLHMCRRNTEKNIETCAILAGKFSKNQLTISHLLVPKQSGTADSCFTESEEEVLEYQDVYGLDTIGWVHTHPSQTAFMSSVDLHTHCSYQLMLPEAVAIVCSPKYNQNANTSASMRGPQSQWWIFGRGRNQPPEAFPCWEMKPRATASVPSFSASLTQLIFFYTSPRLLRAPGTSPECPEQFW
ncbi:hypothetical protein HPB48_003779 [Haemaphysalis longicornis]|uniref:MPN domain-containing protein n=1 Tax=Haemaphysalis longicornis TaxID=44386 RepID=A0A9J6FIV7_HAELO|nr:hypothetical protein HPB48_003779 [Haemaphysalis longicornis]